MAADISSTVYAAMGARDWWDNRADWAAWAVAVGVVLESITEFDTLAKLTGLATRDALRKRIEKCGLLLLIGALVAEVVIGNRVTAQTDIIEAALTSSLRGEISANAGLARKINEEQTDIAGVKTDAHDAKIDVQTAQRSITDLTNKEHALSASLTADEKRLKLVASAILPASMTKRGYDAIQKLRGKVKVVAIASTPDFRAHALEQQIRWAFWDAGIPVREIPAPHNDLWMGNSVVTNAPDIASAGKDPLARALNLIAPFSADPAGTWNIGSPNGPDGVPFISIGVPQMRYEKPPYMGRPGPHGGIPTEQPDPTKSPTK